MNDVSLPSVCVRERVCVCEIEGVCVCEREGVCVRDIYIYKHREIEILR